ncbi:unnamed protein product [Lampetra fluviatilis]
MDRMKKLKRRLSLTLRGGRPVDEALSELAEQMTMEDGTIKDNGTCTRTDAVVRNGKPPASHSMHSFLHQYAGSLRKPPLRRPHSVTGGPVLPANLSVPRHRGDGGVVHENLKMGSDGESDQASGTSSDEVQSPVRVRMRNHPHRRISQEDLNKRLSLPADIRLPEGYLEKMQLNSPPFDKPLSRRLRRASLSEIGFGKLETYTKLDKLGEGTAIQTRRATVVVTGARLPTSEGREFKSWPRVDSDPSTSGIDILLRRAIGCRESGPQPPPPPRLVHHGHPICLLASRGACRPYTTAQRHGEVSTSPHITHGDEATWNDSAALAPLELQRDRRRGASSPRVSRRRSARLPAGAGVPHADGLTAATPGVVTGLRCGQSARLAAVTRQFTVAGRRCVVAVPDNA